MSRISILLGLLATGGLLHILILHLCNVDPNLIDWLISIICGGLFIVAITLDIIEHSREKKRMTLWRNKK